MSKFSLFSVYGIEAEYMIVDPHTLQVKPIADQVLKKLNQNEITNEVEQGRVSWSNELVNHVLEIKSTNPEPSIENLDEVFHESIKNMNQTLKDFSCVLMPTSMHPWFVPEKETVLWPHEKSEIYYLYDEIFGCKGHGWSNLQSVHINLPYSSEEEFHTLHSAIRVVLPLVPALSASSPFFESKKGGFADMRLSFYEKNQEKIPSIIGNVIPEVVHTTNDYRKILSKIYQDISDYENAKTLQQPWLNSRGAMPKFEDGAIEIRLMDIQESSYMDFSVIHMLTSMIKKVAGSKDLIARSEKFSDQLLRQIYEESKKFQPKSIDSDYASFFLGKKESEFSSFLSGLIQNSMESVPEKYHQGLKVIQSKGNLSHRMVKSDLSKDLMKKMIRCLEENSIYE